MLGQVRELYQTIPLVRLRRNTSGRGNLPFKYAASEDFHRIPPKSLASRYQYSCLVTHTYVPPNFFFATSLRLQHASHKHVYS